MVKAAGGGGDRRGTARNRGPIPPEIERTIGAGPLCYVTAETPRGPHLTPLVFVVSEGRMWLTTSRASVKARAWRRDPNLAGMVVARERAVSFVGRVATYDLLDADTWERTLHRVPAISAASARFVRKNARFFAGYAFDARHLPLSWTPPGRVFVEVEMDRAALLDVPGGRVLDVWGAWPGARRRRRTSEPPPAVSFRARRRGPDPLATLPDDVRGPLGRSGPAALAIASPHGPVIVPVSWAADGPDLFAALPGEMARLAPSDGPAPAALAIDRASWWRAREMVGAMAQGQAEAFAVDRLTSGRRSAEEKVHMAGADPSDVVLYRLRPERLVWWWGWSSGSAVL